MLNRTQALALAFGLLAWISLVVILVTAPEIYDQRLRPRVGSPRVRWAAMAAGWCEPAGRSRAP